jgi:hypothetical protein
MTVEMSGCGTLPKVDRAEGWVRSARRPRPPNAATGGPTSCHLCVVDPGSTVLAL